MPSAEVLIRALEHVSALMDGETRLHDQIVVRLHNVYDVSLREIARHSRVSYGTVSNVVHRTEPEPKLILPESIICVLPPGDVITQLCATYKDHDPVQPEELDELWEVFARFPVAGDITPPDWDWIVVGMERLLSHATCDRSTLQPSEIVAQYRQSLLTERWRIENVGEDVHAGIRQHWLDVIGRLTRHSNCC